MSATQTFSPALTNLKQADLQSFIYTFEGCLQKKVRAYKFVESEYIM